MADPLSQEPQLVPDKDDREPGTGAPISDETQRADHTRAVPVPAPPARSPVPPSSQSVDAGSGGRSGKRRRASSSRQGFSPGEPYAASPPYRTPSPQSPAPYPPTRSPARRTNTPRESGLYLPWWSLVVMVGLVAAAAFVVVLTFDALGAAHPLGDQAPQVQIITSQPTLSQDFEAGAQVAPAQPAFWPTPIPQVQFTPTIALPTPVPSPSLPPGNFAIGVMVQVVGVDTSGLNIRSAPGYSGTPRFLSPEGSTFMVVGGPQSVDDLEWWKLEDPEDSTRSGWAARNYLMVVSQ